MQGYHLNLTFPLPDYDTEYLSSPGGHLATLLGHKGAGSVLSYLKTKNLAHHLTASHKQFHKARFSLMLVSIQLTDHGERHVDNIVKVRVSVIRNILGSLLLVIMLYLSPTGIMKIFNMIFQSQPSVW